MEANKDPQPKITKEVVVKLGRRGSKGTPIMRTGFVRCSMPIQIHAPPGEADHLFESEEEEDGQ